MTQTRQAAKIRVVSGFLSALDKCPDCGYEHDVELEVVCSECGYHAGGDLGEEWLRHCEEEMKSLPAGLTLDFAHDRESEDDPRWFDFSVEESADSGRLLKFFDRIAGADHAKNCFAEVILSDRELYPLTPIRLAWCRLEMATDYSAAPTNLRAWRCAGGYEDSSGCLELDAIRQEIEDSEGSSVPSNYKVDAAGVAWAIIQANAGRQVWIGQDEDGYYFAAA